MKKTNELINDEKLLIKTRFETVMRLATIDGFKMNNILTAELDSFFKDGDAINILTELIAKGMLNKDMSDKLKYDIIYNHLLRQIEIFVNDFGKFNDDLCFNVSQKIYAYAYVYKTIKTIFSEDNLKYVNSWIEDELNTHKKNIKEMTNRREPIVLFENKKTLIFIQSNFNRVQLLMIKETKRGERIYRCPVKYDPKQDQLFLSDNTEFDINHFYSVLQK